METMAAYMLPIGSVLHSDTYRVVRYIASGGFGNTYEVEHQKLHKRYCMKEFFMRGVNLRSGTLVTVPTNDSRATFDQMRDKFFKEAQRMALIDTPHVVEVTDCFEENLTAYYVMKLIQGTSLSAQLSARHAPFTEQEVRQMLPQLLEALRGVHSQGLYHLDLKPANIMSDQSGRLWLIDFGASKQMTAAEGRSLSLSSTMCYTAGYAPSEQVGGDVKRIGPWTDLYALGATLYNLLTNQRPPDPGDVDYDGEQAFHFPPSLSADLRQLILWLMQPRYVQRPQSVEQVEQQFGRSYGYAQPQPSWQQPVSQPSQPVWHQQQQPSWQPPQQQQPSWQQLFAVDLGLPSGVKWSSCNLGAQCPEGDGDYFAWAEVSPKDVYSELTYQFYDVRSGRYQSIGSQIGGTTFDVAQMALGGMWRIPSAKQMSELFKHCQRRWVVCNGRPGLEFTGPNGNRIFLPAAGCRYNGQIDGYGAYGLYWTSTLSSIFKSTAYSLGLRQEYSNPSTESSLYYGLSVRPVTY